MTKPRQLLVWAAALACGLGLRSPALATEQGDLIACFKALRTYSEGPGDDLSAFDSNARTTIAVPDRPGGEEGFFIYGDEDVAFQAIPAEDRTGNFHSSDLQFPLPGRPKDDLFFCRYEAGYGETAFPAYVKCDIYPAQGRKYRSVRPHPVTAQQRLWPLKSAVLIRLSTVTPRFRKKVDGYATAVDDYKKSKEDPSAWDTTRAFLGWRNTPPIPPNDDAVYEAVGLCGHTEDADVHEAAVLETKSLNHIAIPQQPE